MITIKQQKACNTTKPAPNKREDKNKTERKEEETGNRKRKIKLLQVPSSREVNFGLTIHGRSHFPNSTHVLSHPVPTVHMLP